MGSYKVDHSDPFVFSTQEAFSQNAHPPGKGDNFILWVIKTVFSAAERYRVACWVSAQESETTHFPLAVVPRENLGFHGWCPG